MGFVNDLWLIAPAILIVGAPFVGAAIVRTAREATLAQRSMDALARRLHEESTQLGARARTFGRTARRLRPDRIA